MWFTLLLDGNQPEPQFWPLRGTVDMEPLEAVVTNYSVGALVPGPCAQTRDFKTLRATNRGGHGKREGVG